MDGAGGRTGRIDTAATLLHGPGSSCAAAAPHRCLSDADGIWASDFEHAVEDIDGDGRLGRLARHGAEPQRVADHPLVTADRRLRQRAKIITGKFLPPMRPRSAIILSCRSRCVGAVSAVSVGAAVERGGATTAASGLRLATALKTSSRSYAPSTDERSTGFITCRGGGRPASRHRRRSSSPPLR